MSCDFLVISRFSVNCRTLCLFDIIPRDQEPICHPEVDPLMTLAKNRVGEYYDRKTGLYLYCMMSNRSVI